MTEAPPDDRFEQAKLQFLAGLASYQAGDFEQALQHYQGALALLPGRVSTLINLAATQMRLARPADALASADLALAGEPGSVDAWLHRATALARLGRASEALAAYEQLIKLEPSHALAWSCRGSLLREMHRWDEAAHAFSQALHHGADAELNGFYLAAVQAAGTPATAPRSYVQALFDDYAEAFDRHVVGQLHYQAHRSLIEGLTALGNGGNAPAASGGTAFAAALDLGCGTGLCGPLLRPLTRRLTGLDLSAGMLAKAQQTRAYDRLEQADLVLFLAQTEERFDLVVAADVFIYVGDLEPVFAGARRVMNPGIFCFTAEAAPEGDNDFVLLPSLRYAHSRRYLRRLAQRHGFELLRMEEGPVRQDQGLAVAGLFVYLRHMAPAPLH